MPYSKYRNRKVTIDGIEFDSIAESRRYLELSLMIKAGAISDLKTHVLFPILVNGIKVCGYEADFVYIENGKRVVEDVKSAITRTDTYMLKKKLMKAANNIEIVEIMS